MIPVVHLWQDDFGTREIPPALFQVTVFRKDGLPDKRCKVANVPFHAWLDATGAERYWKVQIPNDWRIAV